MKRFFACAGILTAALLAGGRLQAQGFAPGAGPFGYGQPPGCAVRQAPDMCNPGFYYTNACGGTYGPCYCLRPPFAPFNGFRPNVGGGGAGGGGPAGIAGFPMHPYVRSPRDFFMVGDP